VVPTYIYMHTHTHTYTHNAHTQHIYIDYTTHQGAPTLPQTDTRIAETSGETLETAELLIETPETPDTESVESESGSPLVHTSLFTGQLMAARLASRSVVILVTSSLLAGFLPPTPSYCPTWHSRRSAYIYTLSE